MSNLTPELEKKVKEELNETPEIREKAMKYLNHLIVSETSLHFPRDDPDFLVRFLRWSKWDYKKAFDRLQRYYKVRKNYAKEYERMRPSLLSNFIRTHKLRIILPERDPRTGCTVVYDDANWRPETVDFEDLIADSILLSERLADDPINQINGVVLISNQINLTPRQLTLFTPSNLYRFKEIFFNTIPVRFKQMHYVNVPSYFYATYNLAMAYVPEKIKKRIIIHKDQESLLQHFDRDFLPKAVGGNLELDYEEAANKLLEWEPTWDKISKYGNKT